MRFALTAGLTRSSVQLGRAVNFYEYPIRADGAECIAVKGPSGAGKTLLLRAIADLDPNQGVVSLEGRDRFTIPGPEWLVRD
ncbi:MAG TPA: ATP-binding cassette domain-containing protein [Stellaceae bacterium]|nr:ATP-binding cassette domain-containing protein [Stellaceae bacterium]